MKIGSARATILGAVLLAASLPVATAPAAAQTEPRRILVTLARASSEPLTAVELDLLIAKKPAEVTRVYQPQERPVQLGLVITDEAGRIDQSLPALAKFLRSLPAGSEVMVAYQRGGSLEMVQTFTADLEKAAGKMRAPTGSLFTGSGNLGQTIQDALASFPRGGTLRQQILYIGEAAAGPDPYNDPPLNRAIAAAQTRGISVWVIRVALTSQGPSAPRRIAEQTQVSGPTPNRIWGPDSGASPPLVPSTSVEAQAPTGLSLKRLAQETGGQAFALGVHPPEALYLDELRALLDRQYLVEFTPPTDKNGQPLTGKLTMAVRGRKGVRLLYPAR